MKPDPLIALGAAALLSAGGRAAKSLTAGGALAATAVGVAILLGAGWPGAAVLAAFFILGSGIGRLLGGRQEGDTKGEQRDAWQVLANGGCAALGAALAAAEPVLALWIVTGSLAAAGADTWATAVGGTSGTPPRLLLVGRPVPAGTNGGMTLLGTAGAMAGAALISAVGAVVTRMPLLLLWGTVIGAGGMLLDSIFGASIQGRFHCPSCDVDSEHRVHRCGSRNSHTGGVAWLTNDGVNALTTAAGALAGWAAWRCVAPA